ncbi:prepilin peptidase [Catenuloplanes atrovinosus]|uniref:Leader peptidase (Prepilin peptidase)/N-methyltransferase n=1 Tax=Catenuloplanes atrovinosus TaxID=137266 RepID=A0AAE4CD55_9ACTN|nr:A24 family peptidase [Catenuloplanes atrovinosus]MDR7280002.1 leader peptidase (prepilin peptidase)/N-methyltransferase [Catenuloplanes atrovinosus]
MSVSLVVITAALGAIIGILTPRVAWRLSVEYGEPPRSACGDCGHPIDSWVRVRVSCPGCGRRLGPRPWLTTVVGAATFALLGWAFGPDPALPGYLAVAAVGVLLAFVDLAVLRLPDPLVGAAGVLGGGVLLLISLLDWSFAPLLRALLGALVLFGVYLVIALIPGANLGFGDVKLSAVLGLMLGWLGWPAVVLGLLLPHLLNGPVALVLLLTGRAGRGTDLPLGPALLAGTLVAVVIARHGLPLFG